MSIFENKKDIEDEFKRNEMKHQIKEAVTEWCKSSTSHGLPNIIRAQNSIIRFMWICFCLMSASYCGYTIITCLNNYLKYDVTVQLSIVRESPTDFPAVTFCNLVPFNKMNLDKYLNVISLGKNATNIRNMTSFTNVNAIDVVRDMSSAIKTQVITDKNLTDSDRKNLGYAIEDMIISCKFNKIQCNGLNFTNFWTYNYGNCYTFNGGYDISGNKASIAQTSQYGDHYGLEMELFLGDPTRSVDFSYNTGIYLYVHNQTIPSYFLLDGINIPTGFETYVSIGRSLSTKLSKPYSNCLHPGNSEKISFNTRIYDFMTNSLNLTIYSQKICQKLCYSFYVADNCYCEDPTMPKLQAGLQYCSSNNQTNCVQNVSTLFASSNLNDLCEAYCPENCDSAFYTINNYMATYPTTYYANSLKMQSNLIQKFPINQQGMSSYMNEGILKVTINYNDLSYTSIDESPAITVDQLFGNIGGQLGLFIGISILSVIEIFELLLELLQIYFHSKKRDRVGNS